VVECRIRNIKNPVVRKEKAEL